MQRGEPDVAGRDGPGLVETQHVDSRQHLDRRELLGERIAAGQRDHAGHERQAGQQHQPVGHHRHRGCNGAEERVLPVVLAREKVQEQEDRRDRDHPGEPTQDPVDSGPQLRLRRLEVLGLGGEAARVAVGTDRRRGEEAVARDDEAP